MSPEGFKQLEEADWKEIGAKLAAYAVWRARNFAWRTGNAHALAKGWEPEDVAKEAIRRAWEGKWDPDRGPLFPFLKMVVDGLMINLAESKDNEVQKRIALKSDGDENWDAAEYGARHNDGAGLLSDSNFREEASGETTPHSAETKVARLFAAVEGDQKLTEVLEAVMEGYETPRELAERLGTERADIYNRLKRLRRRNLEVGLEKQIGTAKRASL